LSPTELLKKHEDYLKFKAKYYSDKGLEYEDTFNQGYLFLLEIYKKSPFMNPQKLIRMVDHKLRTYYNKEIKEGYNKKYGLDPEDIDV